MRLLFRVLRLFRPRATGTPLGEHDVQDATLCSGRRGAPGDRRLNVGVEIGPAQRFRRSCRETSHIPRRNASLGDVVLPDSSTCLAYVVYHNEDN